MDVPTGSVLAFAGPVLPAGYQFCYGQVESSTDPIYAALFKVIGTAHGGDGAPNFNLPDYRGQFLRGVDHSRGLDQDSGQRGTPMAGSGNGGDRVGSVQPGQIATHTHSFTGQFLQAQGGGGFNGHGFDGNSGPNPKGFTMDATGGTETRPTNAYVEYIIKL
jgi:microcystin-dependent protein